MQGYFKTGNNRTVIFDAFHRKNPCDGGYSISCGLDQVIDYIKNNRKDIKTIRIDTHEDNKIMQHLIDKNGFTKVGELHGVYRPEENSYVYALLTGN